MNYPWLPPNINPLQRLSVSDGLLIDAERWQLAHNYHYQRQNAHFQSLNQPGIVSDMGVLLTNPPEDIPAPYRDGRWLQIQPGLAIDIFGNLIVIPEPIDFRITSQTLTETPQLLYIVVSYVDPDTLAVESHHNNNVVTETFRIDEKNSPPTSSEVELLRISLTRDPITLAIADNVSSPASNELDLRYRPQARPRQQESVHLSYIQLNSPEDEQIHSNLAYLSQSIATLYPPWQGQETIGKFSLQDVANLENIIGYDVLFLKTYPEQPLNFQDFTPLYQYIKWGGCLLVEASIEGTKIDELITLYQQLQEAIARLKKYHLSPTNPSSNLQFDPAEIQASLEDELAAIDLALDREIQTRCAEFQPLAEKLGGSLQPLRQLSPHHPLKTQPFVFSALPIINDKSLGLLLSQGLIIIIGDLSTAWGVNSPQPLPRETIRNAQELGINLIHYAHRRHKLIQLQKPPPI